MYPLKFEPVFQQRLWGGQRLRSILGKAPGHEFDGQGVGESWELADLPSGTVKADSRGAAPDGSLSSRILNGPMARETLHAALRQWPGMMGNVPLNNGHFPLLIKFLDAQQDLSVQVHPDTAYCQRHPEAHLKSEAWYILHAEPGARIYKGLKPGVSRDQFRTALENGQVEPLLHAVKVRPGDCHFLASGTLHALGAGILAAEVQTPSDTTFRVFDWNRLGPTGKPRTLHVSEALEVINFIAPGPHQPTTHSPAGTGGIGGGGTRLVSCDYFTLDRVQLPQGQMEKAPPGIAVWIILEGQGVISCDGYGPTAFARGDTLLLPANMKDAAVKTIANCTWLDARVPAKTMS
jgi:mannose-6-phosphate isomerase